MESLDDTQNLMAYSLVRTRIFAVREKQIEAVASLINISN